TSSNILRWFETAGLVNPRRHGSTIIGIDEQLPTSHAARGLAQLIADRLAARGVHPPANASPVDLAIGVGANRWINLTPEEFRSAAVAPATPATPLPRGALPVELVELHHE